MFDLLIATVISMSCRDHLRGEICTYYEDTDGDGIADVVCEQMRDRSGEPIGDEYCEPVVVEGR